MSVIVNHGLGPNGKVIESVFLNHDMGRPIGYYADGMINRTDKLDPEEMINLTLDERINRFRSKYDQDGNKIMFSKRKRFYRVDLWLPHDKQKPNRCIGRIVETKKGVVYRVLKYMHDHHYRELDSFGFNDTLIHQVLTDDDKVVVRIKETGEVLETTVATIKQHGTYRRYKSSGLERQVFLSIGYFTLIK